MTRQVLFQIHWFLGITAGLVLAVMGLTGAAMSFEDEIMRALSPGIVSVPAQAAPPLTPGQLLERASAQRGGLDVAMLTIESRPGDAARVSFAPPPGQHGRGESTYQDPYTGALLGPAHGERFFATVRRLHRWLALPGDGNGAGRIITGISALALVYFALSGLYLRWPRKPLDWRSWLVLDLRRSGRNLYRTLHAVIGGWMLAFYLLSALTGLWWSFEWYRSGINYMMTGQTEAPAEHRAGPAQGRGAGGGKKAHGHHGEAGGTAAAPSAVAPSLDRAWAGFQHATGDRFGQVDIFLPGGPGPVRFRALLEGARHDRMTDEIRVDPVDGRVLAVDRYADRPLGSVMITGMLTLHRGSFFGLPGRIVMATTSLSLPLFTVTGLLLYLGRRKRKRALRDLQPLPDTATVAAGDDSLLIAYASQTGAAQRLARQTAAAFESAGEATRVLPLSRLGAAELAAATRALFVVSTYADGEPPDEARGFARRAMAAPAALAHLEYAVLALGDREYPDFCAFGRRLEHWLEHSGGRRLFERVELDGDDAEAQRQWERRIGALGARSEPADWQPEPYRPWRLAERRLLNPGSPGAPVFHIALEPVDGTEAQWEPGDIAEILPRQDPARIAAFLAAAKLDSYDEAGQALLAAHLSGHELPTDPAMACADTLAPLRQREYSIASIAAAGRIELLVRQQSHADGRLGVGSGWLTAHAPLGDEIELRIRPNPGFRPPEAAGPAILVGNGTGLAGLLAHLRHRAATGIGPTWLLFGERSGIHDRLHAEELERHLASGALARLDLIFSRDAGGGYVQRLAETHAEALRCWVGDGASIFVCGSLQGMAPELDAALRRVLGDDAVDRLGEQGRYRRDVY